MAVLPIVLFYGLAGIGAEDKPGSPLPAILEAAEDAKRVQRVLRAPDDVQFLREYVRDTQQQLSLLTYDDPAKATARLNSFETLLNRLRPGTADAQLIVSRAKQSLSDRKASIGMAQMPYAELEAKLISAPDDYDLFQKWAAKVTYEGIALAYARPDDAQKMLMAASAFTEKLGGITRNEQIRFSIAAASDPFSSPWGMTKRLIDDGRKLAAMTGKDADALAVKGWAVGPPTTFADHRGSVFLISYQSPNTTSRLTFPYLKAWHAKYAISGLKLVGVMNGSAERLQSFATENELPFPIAIRDGVHTSYGLADKDGLVVVNRQGKLRLVRAEPYLSRNLEDIDKVLGELLSTSPPK